MGAEAGHPPCQHRRQGRLVDHRRDRRPVPRRQSGRHHRRQQPGSTARSDEPGRAQRPVRPRRRLGRPTVRSRRLTQAPNREPPSRRPPDPPDPLAQAPFFRYGPRSPCATASAMTGASWPTSLKSARRSRADSTEATKPAAFWEWLENRRRLGELPQGLVAIGRQRLGGVAEDKTRKREGGRGMPIYDGKTKLAFCKRLGEDWQDLAIISRYPSATAPRFGRGDEPREVWEWLERRTRLGELAGALRDPLVDREELVDPVLEPPPVSVPDEAIGLAGFAVSGPAALQSRGCPDLLWPPPGDQGPAPQAGRSRAIASSWWWALRARANRRWWRPA